MYIVWYVIQFVLIGINNTLARGDATSFETSFEGGRTDSIVVLSLFSLYV